MKSRNHPIFLHKKNSAGWCFQGRGASVVAPGWDLTAQPLLREQDVVTPGPLIRHKCVGWEGQDDLKSSFSLVCCYSGPSKSCLRFCLPWLGLQCSYLTLFAESNLRLLLSFCGQICA